MQTDLQTIKGKMYPEIFCRIPFASHYNDTGYIASQRPSSSRNALLRRAPRYYAARKNTCATARGEAPIRDGTLGAAGDLVNPRAAHAILRKVTP